MKTWTLLLVVLVALVALSEARPRKNVEQSHKSTKKHHKQGDEESDSRSHDKYNKKTGRRESSKSHQSKKSYNEGSESSEESYYRHSGKGHGKHNKDEGEEKEDTFRALVRDYVAAQVPDLKQQRIVVRAVLEAFETRLERFIKRAIRQANEDIEVVSAAERVRGLVREQVDNRKRQHEVIEAVLEELNDNEVLPLSKLQELIDEAINGNGDDDSDYDYEEEEEESVEDRIKRIAKEMIPKRSLRHSIVQKAVARAEQRSHLDYTDKRVRSLIKYLLRKSGNDDYYGAAAEDDVTAEKNDEVVALPEESPAEETPSA